MSGKRKEKKGATRPQQKTLPMVQPMSVAAAQKAAAANSGGAGGAARAPSASKTTPAPTVSPTVTSSATSNKPAAKGEGSFSFRPLVLGLIAGLAIAAGVTAYRARGQLASAPSPTPDPAAISSSGEVHETAIAFGVSRGAAQPSASASPPPAQTFAEAMPPPTSQSFSSKKPPGDNAPDAGASKPRGWGGGNAQASNTKSGDGKSEKPEEPKKPPQQPTSVDSLLQQQLKSTIP